MVKFIIIFISFISTLFIAFTIYKLYAIMLNSFKKDKLNKKKIENTDKFTKDLYIQRLDLEALMNEKKEYKK